MMDINRIKRLFLQSNGMKKQVENNLIQNKITLDNLNDRIKLLEQAQVFLQKVAQDTQSQLKFQIEDIVNLALETCFPNEYKFQLQFNIARGKTDAELVFLSQKMGRPIDPMNCAGCGTLDVTCFALRLACYALQVGIDNVIILDEPMKFVSKDLLESVSQFMKEISTKLGIQMIMVTHETQFIDIADKIFSVRKNRNGRSIVTVK
jgi:DNA repair ATPase RecN